MKVVVFGATGMIGQGVVRECLLDPDVESVVSVGRSPSGVNDPKFHEVLTADLLDLKQAELSGTEQSRTMWARVRGATENALLATSLNVYILRPGFIQPRHGATSRTPLYRVLYRFVGVLYPVVRTLFPKHVSTTEQLGRAMIGLARHGADKKVLHSRDFNAVTP
jgi:uncharacterized protein YbjT (DUF2867 family)